MTSARGAQISRRLEAAYDADVRHGKPDMWGVVYKSPRHDKVIAALKRSGEWAEYVAEFGYNRPNPKGNPAKKYFLMEGSEVFAGPYWDKAEAQAAARREGKYSPSPGIWKKKRLRVKAVSSNPAAEAAEASTEFHGRGPDELVPVKQTVHFHKHLAGAGKLEKLTVKSRGFIVTLKGFKGALLAFNEQKTQLFIEGGDQSVDLKAFGVKVPHEVQTLGELVAIEYFTTKDHLGSDGGTATYHHRFHKPYPVLIYHSIDKRLSISGGSYDIKAEGIDK